MVHKDTILVSLVLIVGTCLHVPTSELLLVAPSLALLACVPTGGRQSVHFGRSATGPLEGRVLATPYMPGTNVRTHGSGLSSVFLCGRRASPLVFKVKYYSGNKQ
jgi:hypothetical protein